MRETREQERVGREVVGRGEMQRVDAENINNCCTVVEGVVIAVASTILSLQLPVKESLPSLLCRR